MHPHVIENLSGPSKRSYYFLGLPTTTPELTPKVKTKLTQVLCHWLLNSLEDIAKPHAIMFRFQDFEHLSPNVLQYVMA